MLVTVFQPRVDDPSGLKVCPQCITQEEKNTSNSHSIQYTGSIYMRIQQAVCGKIKFKTVFIVMKRNH